VSTETDTWTLEGSAREDNAWDLPGAEIVWDVEWAGAGAGDRVASPPTQIEPGAA